MVIRFDLIWIVQAPQVSPASDACNRWRPVGAVQGPVGVEEEDEEEEKEEDV
jgi:hypothetical protein